MKVAGGVALLLPTAVSTWTSTVPVNPLGALALQAVALAQLNTEALVPKETLVAPSSSYRSGGPRCRPARSPGRPR